MTKHEAIWDSFCHWSENWERSVEHQTILLGLAHCALCRKYFDEWCYGCPLGEWGVGCGFGGPYAEVLHCRRRSAKQRTAACAVMAICLLFVFYAEGGRKVA